VARFATDSGIKVLSLQSLRDFEALPEASRAWTFEHARRFLALAIEIGAPLLIVCANTRSDTLGDPDAAAADLAALADMAAEWGLRVGYEALSTSHAVRTYPEAWRIIEKADRPNLGLVLGAVHIFATGADLAGLNAIEPERIFLVHLADAPTIEMDVRLLSRHFRVFPGQGDLPIADLFKTLRAWLRGSRLDGDLQRSGTRSACQADRRRRHPGLSPSRGGHGHKRGAPPDGSGYRFHRVRLPEGTMPRTSSAC
jgi:4-hydroxyphenylpyruvate dioxygenase